MTGAIALVSALVALAEFGDEAGPGRPLAWLASEVLLGLVVPLLVVGALIGVSWLARRMVESHRTGPASSGSQEAGEPNHELVDAGSAAGRLRDTETSRLYVLGLTSETGADLTPTPAPRRIDTSKT